VIEAKIEIGRRTLEVSIPDWVKAYSDLELLMLLQKQVFLKDITAKYHPLSVK